MIHEVQRGIDHLNRMGIGRIEALRQAYERIRYIQPLVWDKAETLTIFCFRLGITELPGEIAKMMGLNGVAGIVAVPYQATDSNTDAAFRAAGIDNAVKTDLWVPGPTMGDELATVWLTPEHTLGRFTVVKTTAYFAYRPREERVYEVRRGTDAISGMGVGRAAIARAEYDELALYQPEWEDAPLLSDRQDYPVEGAIRHVSDLLGFPADTLAVMDYNLASQDTDIEVKDKTGFGYAESRELEMGEWGTGMPMKLNYWVNRELGIGAFSINRGNTLQIRFYVAYRGK